MVGKRLAEEVRHAAVVFCNKVKCFRAGRVERGLDGLAPRVRDGSGHESLELAGVVGAVAVELALVDGSGQVPEDEPHGRVCPEWHSDFKPVVENTCDKRALFGDAGLFLDYAGQCEHLVPVAERLPHGTRGIFF